MVITNSISVDTQILELNHTILPNVDKLSLKLPHKKLILEYLKESKDLTLFQLIKKNFVQ